VSDLPPHALSYQVVVTEYFLGLRGSGLLLSPLDQELVTGWERRGLPVAVVCRGLRRALEGFLLERPPHAQLPRALRAYRFGVEDEWRAYKSGRVGASSAPPLEAGAVAARREAALAGLEDLSRTVSAPLGALYREARTRLQAVEAASLPELEAALARVDDALLTGWIRLLSRPERSDLGPRCRLLAGIRPAGMRLGAYREGLRAHLWDAAQAAGLLRVRDSGSE
jgi:hypothetical protein